jgi:hypothetical protein
MIVIFRLRHLMLYIDQLGFIGSFDWISFKEFRIKNEICINLENSIAIS